MMPTSPMRFKNRRKGDIIEVPPRARLQQAVLKVVMRGGEWSTGNLTAEIGCAHSSCYGACRALQDKHLVTSKKRVAGQVYWDPVTGTVMSQANHDWMDKERRKAAGSMLKVVNKRLRKHAKRSVKHITSKLGELLDPGMMSAARIDGVTGEDLRRRLGGVSFDYCPHGWWLAVQLTECLALMVLLLEKSKVIPASNQNAWLKRKIREILSFVPVSYSEADWLFDKQWELVKAA